MYVLLISPAEKDKIEDRDREWVCMCVCVCLKILSVVPLGESDIYAKSGYLRVTFLLPHQKRNRERVRTFPFSMAAVSPEKST